MTAITTTTAWTYDGVEVLLTREEQSVPFATVLAGLVFLVAAPLAAAGWALSRFWPVSGAVWLGVAAVLWGVMLATAVEAADE